MCPSPENLHVIVGEIAIENHYTMKKLEPTYPIKIESQLKAT
jgi:hypothetical protein